MDVELGEECFTDFGVDALFPYARTGLSRIDGESTDELREAVRRYVPKCAAVYGMVDALGRLIYVGKSKLLRNRLLSYFLPNNEEDKSGRIVQSSRTIVWEPQPSEFAALLREQYLIRSFLPRFNVQGIPKRQQPIFICLGRSPAEQLYTARKPDPKAIFQLGPLYGAGRAGRAVEVLNRVFQLRDCSSKQPCSFTDQMQLFDIELRPGCIRLEIESCLGPCISACSRSAYETQVLAAKSFLRGKDENTVPMLETTMQEAAANLHFERAITLREDLHAVRWLHRRAADLAQARERYTFIYQVRGTDCRRKLGAESTRFDIWYLIRKGVVEAALPAPQTPQQRQDVVQQIERWLQEDNSMGGQFSPREETLALVTSWFRNNRGQLKQTLKPRSIIKQALAEGQPASTEAESGSPRRKRRAKRGAKRGAVAAE